MKTAGWLTTRLTTRPPTLGMVLCMCTSFTTVLGRSCMARSACDIMLKCVD